jgi:dTDP-4-amino-4,6-dideoxygalactose transaminase
VANAFSFHPLKTLNACGDGGAITTNDKELYEALTKLRNHGLRDRDHADIFGYNSRLDALQAAILSVKMKYLDKWNEMRRANAKVYHESLSDLVDVPFEPPYARSVYHTYIIKYPERDALQKFLEKNGIETKIHYPVPIHRQNAWRQLTKKKGRFPVCEKLARTMLSLPVHQCLTGEQVNYVCETIERFVKRK